MSAAKVDSLLAALFPRRCILCAQPAGMWNCCSGCLRDMPWITSACSRCGDVLPVDYRGSVCGHCSDFTPAIDRIISALVYEYPVDKLIAMAKFQGRADSACVLGELLASYLCTWLDSGDLARPDLILPVPLHRKRIAQRGFNQATEIARPLANALQIPLCPDACRRIRNTAEQTRLDARQRRKNTRDAFRASPSMDAKHVVVVDDVITTGSTVQSMAVALRDAGAREIQVWTVARRISPNIARGPATIRTGR
jgi:ComF family protein